jgi:hypothetical protein
MTKVKQSLAYRYAKSRLKRPDPIWSAEFIAGTAVLLAILTFLKRSPDFSDFSGPFMLILLAFSLWSDRGMQEVYHEQQQRLSGFETSKEPNQALEPTATAVTDRAAHAPRQP